LQLEGRVFDPNDSLFTTPKSTFTWRIATEDMVIERSEKRNFNVAANKDVFFVIDLDIDKLFLGLQPSLPHLRYILIQAMRQIMVKSTNFK